MTEIDDIETEVEMLRHERENALYCANMLAAVGLEIASGLIDALRRRGLSKEEVIGELREIRSKPRLTLVGDPNFEIAMSNAIENRIFVLESDIDMQTHFVPNGRPN
jgi:hypothetical protein